jgi:hypothetical protein
VEWQVAGYMDLGGLIAAMPKMMTVLSLTKLKQLIDKSFLKSHDKKDGSSTLRN